MSNELILGAALVGAGMYITYLLRQISMLEYALEGIITGSIQVVTVDREEDDE